jgi:hypothetical protein
MYCGGGHLGFPIDIKKHIFCRGPSNDHSWAVWFQLSKWFQRRSMFQTASSLKPLGQLKPNCPGIVIGRSSTKFMLFYADRKFKMAATAGHRLTLDPMGKYSNAMYCCGSHLGFLIGIKNIIFVENLPMIIPGQFGFNCPSGFREEAF